MLRASDANFLWRALALAERGAGHTRPNPPVGAVVVRNGKIIGEGWHKRAGTDHAEVAAIRDALRKSGEAVSSPLQRKKSSLARSGKDSASPLKGATIYVTLEPCSRPGRVGACTDAIVAAGIKTVVYAVPDPNPTNRGRAKRVLAKAGVSCEAVRRGVCEAGVWEACGGFKSLQEAARRLIAPFAKHVTTGWPYVTVKLAMSLDGRICDNWGEAKWITSATSRKVVGWERAAVDAIMVGAETVRRDNPSLLSHNKRNDDLIRVVVSRSGRLPRKAQVFADGKNPTLVFKDAKTALRELGKRGALHVLCEGGLKLATSLADQGLVDRWIAVTAPIVIGSRHLKDALRLRPYAGGMSDPVAGDCEERYERMPNA